MAGVSLVTFGLGGTMVSGPARWLILAAGFFGMGVITLSITYILQVQNALQRRDSGVMKLTTTAGRPPTGIELLETYAELGCRAELGELFREWRNWSNAVLYSHAAHPVLAYFRSVSANIDWPTAAEVALDAASLLLAFVDEKNIGQAALLHRDGSRLAAVMARIFEVELKDAPAVTPAAVAVLRDRLSVAGYPLKSEKDAAEVFAKLRSDYAGRLAALAKHVGAATAELLPD
ncbi:MAG TPA: hypothetical protein VGM17_06170 [Rhizomicrobium sp.]